MSEQDQEQGQASPVQEVTQTFHEIHLDDDDTGSVVRGGEPDEASDPATSTQISAAASQPSREVETPVSQASPPPRSNPSEISPSESPAPPAQPNIANIIQSSRGRADSSSTVATFSTQRSARSSLLFVVTSLESIAASKDARKNKKLGEAVQRALQAVKSDQETQVNPEVLFNALNLATDVSNVQVVTTALDCLGKLMSYSYFAMPSDVSDESSTNAPLIDRAIDTICDCFQSEATPPETQLQIVKSLLAAILNDKVVVHGAGLLKAVRLTYNIFLLSKSSINQQIAQGALTQMIGTVFERVKSRLSIKIARANASKASLATQDSEDLADGEDYEDALDPSTENAGPVDHDDAEALPVEKRRVPTITLQSFENRKSFDDAKISEAAPTVVTRSKGRQSRAASRPSLEQPGDHEQHGEEEEDEIFIKDAYLVFRAMCRLSTKAIAVEHALDVKSQGMRSKLLSLHIIYTLLTNHTTIFTSPLVTIKSSAADDPTPFIQAVKQYLCLSLSRNGASSVRPVFEVSCEIFWLMLKDLRVMLKKEVEVFVKEIYLAILEKRAAPSWQKQIILGVFQRLASDPRALVEVYLNYDCDRTALDNMFERIVEHLSRIASTTVTMTATQHNAFVEHRAKVTPHQSDLQHRMLPPSLSTAALTGPEDKEHAFPLEYVLKQSSIDVMVHMLRSLYEWSGRGVITAAIHDAARASIEDPHENFDGRRLTIANGSATPHMGGSGGFESPSGPPTPSPEDDPRQFDLEKQRKTALAAAIRQFNFKPKRGIKQLIDGGFIESKEPIAIARFLLDNEQINKASLGEYLGEGEDENIAIMHEFVDLMEFRQTRFVDALRRFLQSFRLPGEAQKIDRYMLKFAERYINGNPKAFANADTAYVLAYSVVMLNTDQHSANVKKRMTPEDFIKNNRGINDNADLPEEYLRGIFDEIAHNEIVLDTERERAANLGQETAPTAGLAATIGQAVANASRDLRKEEYAQTEQLANRTEQLYKSLLRSQRRSASSKMQISHFVPATSIKHVGSMFQFTWMPIFTALTAAAQDAIDMETVKLCLEGQKLAVRIACLFDLEDPREAFLSSLARFTNLYNTQEMRPRNVEAVKVLLEIANTEGNKLGSSWESILTCVSQLERYQLISSGVDESAVPLSGRNTPAARDQKRREKSRPSRPRTQSSGIPFYDVQEESRSADIVRGVDGIFSNTAKLSGDAIIHFVKALTHVSWQEIQSSGQSESPRTFSLQKIVEVCNYNMTRVKFEWTSIWQILGAHFNEVGCHTNTHIVFFALDSLRQLSIRFFDLEELSGFRFQKDFLRPFEHILANSAAVTVKDMVLRCLVQMIQVKGEKIRSGWRTMFGAFTVAAKEPYEGIVNFSYDQVTQVFNARLGVIISQGAFSDLVICLTSFSKNQKFQKKGLQAIEALKSLISRMLITPECPLSPQYRETEGKTKALVNGDTEGRKTSFEEQYWFPVLFAFHDILMTGDDLEIRSRALDYLFETLLRYGGTFNPNFWDTLWRSLLYPIFMVLRSKTELTKMTNTEELAVWLSTTMIQALRNMVKLFTHFFESLEYMLDRFLDLLILCVCQENDTLARIGSNCLQQLILQNVTKFSPEHWHRIVDAFIELFQRTEATALFLAAVNGQTPKMNGLASPDGGISGVTSNTASLNLATPDTEDQEEEPRFDSLGINGGPTEAQSTVDKDIDAQVTAERERRNTSAAIDLEDYNTSQNPTEPQQPALVTAARRRFFNQIITKCVLSLLMIETVNELFSNDAVYASIPSPELLRLMSLLKKSYHFAKRFNNDRDLRTRLFKEGFMKQPPNLLKQESGAAAVYVSILFRMYHDTNPNRIASREETQAALIPLCADIITSFIELDEDTQQRNIVTWRPVVVDVIEGYVGLPPDVFDEHLPTFAPLIVGLLGREMASDLQKVIQAAVARIFESRLGITTAQT